MEKVRYMISDAADMVHVETHVLRYWEEELALDVPRNEMGHRYYTRENIREFQKIKELKEQGYQLKAIRNFLHSESGGMDVQITMSQTEELKEHTTERHHNSEMVGYRREATPDVSGITPEERMAQFRELMSDIVGRAIAMNNEELSQTIGKDVHEMVIKEMNYLMREQENAQEERYRKLDAAIRGTLKKKPGLPFGKKRKKEL